MIKSAYRYIYSTSHRAISHYITSHSDIYPTYHPVISYHPTTHNLYSIKHLATCISCLATSPILIHSNSVTSSTSILFLLQPLLHPFFHLYFTLLYSILFYSFFHLYSTLYYTGHLYQALSVECQKSEEKLYKIKRARTGDILGE